MNKSEVTKGDKLIFIDTNVYLDFYRTPGMHFQSSMVKLLNKNKDKIIFTNQVFMEFLKNRNKLIIEIFNGLKIPSLNIFRTPTFLNDDDTVTLINETEEIINRVVKILKSKTEILLEHPISSDNVYKFLYDLSITPSNIYLNDDHKDMPKYKQIASDKLLLGYPPSKKNDRSMGDLINWEWIINCASNLNKDVIIVSKDNDFGHRNKDHFYLNEWLKNDFTIRTDNKLSVSLTEKLTQGFEMLNIHVSEEAIKEEKNLQDIQNNGLLSALLGENYNNNLINASNLPLSSLLQPSPNQDNKS